MKFHVTPLTPKTAFIEFLTNRNVIISYPRPDNYKEAVKICNKIYIDNGAYTFYRKKTKPDWDKFYKWLNGKKFDYFFIPDVIDGSELENDLLIDNCPKDFINKGIPVWHLHESLDRLFRLCNTFDYIALGSSGEYWKIGTIEWFNRMDEAMKVICNKLGYPKVKAHMLRCLNPKIFTKYPFYSADSSNLAQNHHIKGGDIILKNIESFDFAKKYNFQKQLSLFNKE